MNACIIPAAGEKVSSVRGVVDTPIYHDMVWKAQILSNHDSFEAVFENELFLYDFLYLKAVAVKLYLRMNYFFMIFVPKSSSCEMINC